MIAAITLKILGLFGKGNSYLSQSRTMWCEDCIDTFPLNLRNTGRDFLFLATAAYLGGPTIY